MQTCSPIAIAALGLCLACAPSQRAFAAIVKLDFYGYGEGPTYPQAVENARNDAKFEAAKAGYYNCQDVTYTYRSSPLFPGYLAQITVMCEKDTNPPPPPPPPPQPPPTIYPPLRNGADHIVRWSLPAAVQARYVLEQRINGGGWRELYKGEATSWTQRAAAVATYDYRVSRIMNDATPWSQIVSIVVSSPPAVPAAPVAPTVVAPTHVVTWGASLGADTYQLDRVGADGVWNTVYLGPATRWTAVDTPPGAYLYRVTACLNTACSAPSADSLFQVAFDISPVVNYLLNP